MRLERERVAVVRSGGFSPLLGSHWKILSEEMSSLVLSLKDVPGVQMERAFSGGRSGSGRMK